MRARKKRGKNPDKYARDLEGFVPKYIEATGDHEWTTAKVAAWAIENDLWTQRKINAIRQLARELAAVLRQVTFPDEDGNNVQKYYAFRLGERQPMLWKELEEMTRNDMAEAGTMRRNKWVGGAIKLTINYNYFNKHHNPGDPLVFDPDLTKDIAEYFQPRFYDDAPPDDNGDSTSSSAPPPPS